VGRATPRTYLSRIETFVEDMTCGGKVVREYSDVLKGFSADLPSKCVVLLESMRDSFPDMQIEKDSVAVGGAPGTIDGPH